MLSKVRNTMAWLAYSSGRLTRPAPDFGDSLMREDSGCAMRLAVWLPLRQIENTVPLSMPSRAPTQTRGSE